jgi:mRNA-degrading endonuclease toxin of MazEF toxin-antitoxin module
LRRTDKQKRPRRNYAKGVDIALANLESISTALHKDEVAGKTPAVAGCTVLRHVLNLQETVFGEPSMDTLVLLGARHKELKQHVESGEAFAGVVRYFQSRGDSQSLARALQQLSLSYDAQGREDEGSETREQSLAVLARMIGADAITMSLFREVAGDAALAGGLSAAPTASAVVPGPKEVKRGQIWWAKWPQYPDDPHQPRPGVICSSDRHHESDGRVFIAPVYSRANQHPTNVFLPARVTGMEQDAWVKSGNMTSMQRQMLIRQERGQIPESIVVDIVNASRQVFQQS